LITGASAGIGRELAKAFAARGFNLVLVARREDRLRALADDLTAKYRVAAKVIPADLSEQETPQRIYDELEAAGILVDALVNNAGLGLAEGLLTGPWADQADLIAVMVTAPTQLCALFAPGMAERGYGRILNVSSVAAFVPPERASLYSSAKSFVLLMSQGLALELKHRGVHVTALCPGLTHTEFHEVMGVNTRASRLFWMSAEEVAEQGIAAVMAGKDVYINGWVNRLLVLACSLIPSSLIQKRRARLLAPKSSPPK
jgi:hypothetical protein